MYIYRIYLSRRTMSKFSSKPHSMMLVRSHPVVVPPTSMMAKSSLVMAAAAVA